jgi:hypothetical protein
VYEAPGASDAGGPLPDATVADGAASDASGDAGDASEASVWTPMNAGFFGATLTSIAIDPVDDLRIVIGTTGGVYVTRNRGSLWFHPATAPNDSVAAVAISPANPSIVYAMDTIGIAVSTDAGEHWGAPVFPGRCTTGLAADPADETVAYATCAGLLYITKDRGKSWSSTGDGLPVQNVRGLVAAESKTAEPFLLITGGDPQTNAPVVYRSGDRGGVWLPSPVTPLPSGPVSSFMPGFDKTDGVYLPCTNADPPAAPSVSLCRSDTGVGWEVERVQPDILQAFAWLGNPGAIDLLRTNDGLLYRNGETSMWTVQGSPTPVVTCPEFGTEVGSALGAMGAVWTTCNRVGPYSTFDMGTTWTLSNDGIEAATIQALVIHPRDPNTLYARAAEGFWVSHDGAATWVAANQGLEPGPGQPADFTGVAIAVDDLIPPEIVLSTELSMFVSTGPTRWEPFYDVGDFLLAFDELTENFFVVTRGSVSSSTPPSIRAAHPNGAITNPIAAPSFKTASRVQAVKGTIYVLTDLGLVSGPATGPFAILPSAPACLDFVVDPNDANTIVCFTNAGFAISSTGGEGAWKPLPSPVPGVPGVFAIAPSEPNRLYFATADAFFSTPNFRAEDPWQRGPSGFPAAPSAILVDPSEAKTVYLTLPGHGVWKTTTGGATQTGM